MDVDVHSDSEEEILVYAEFKEGVDVNKYRSIHVLGIDDKNPIIQADDSFFTGKFVNALGTYMFFEEDSSPQAADPLFDKLPDTSLKYLCKTNKLLEMDHAYVMPIASKDPVVKTEAEETTDSNIQPIRFNSLNEALQKFKTALIPVINPDASCTARDLRETKMLAESIISNSKIPSEDMDT